MPRLRLPPLPAAREWSKWMPKSFPRLEGVGPREGHKRHFLANRELSDEFVRTLGIRKGEVVIDAYCGPGGVTRSLLAGGYDETSFEDWEKVAEEKKELISTIGKGKLPASQRFTFPPWDASQAQSVPEVKVPKKVTVPKLVVANDPLISLLGRGMGFERETALASRSRMHALDDKEAQAVLNERKPMVYASSLEDRLVFSPESVYKWSAVPAILDDPLVYKHLPVYDKTKKGAEATYHPWTETPPPITFVVTVPEGTMGDQLVSQWVATACGDDSYGRSWLFKWGRVRIALLAHRGIYDRLMAKPGENIHCKLSVMAQTLFDMRPLPPYHHVPNVDKKSQQTHTSVEDGIAAYKQAIAKRAGPDSPAVLRASFPAPPPIDFVTQTKVEDFYPIYKVNNRKPDYSADLGRPTLLGIEMIPKFNTPMLPQQRDMWEFLLRKFFVRESTTIVDQLPTIAFGAENLMPRIADKSESCPYRGKPVAPDERIRNLSVDQWARIVDVFDKWAFKPEVLVLDIQADDKDEDRL